MKTIETTGSFGDDHILRADLRASLPLEKGIYRAVIVIDEQPKLAAEPPKPLARFRQAGTAKGKIWMADDFDETPEDFKDYM